MNQLFAAYATGKEARNWQSSLGSCLTDIMISFMLSLRISLKQGMCPRGFYEDRTIEDTLKLGWELLSILPRAELKRIRDEYLDKYLPSRGEG